VTNRTETEAFWAGEFGDTYHQRQAVTHEANVDLFARILAATGDVKSIAELGAGTGLNLQALRAIDPELDLCGVEINEQAVHQILKIPTVVGVHASALDWMPTRQFDMTFTKGMLIHIPPADLPTACRTLVDASRRYVMIAEYFNPTPLEVMYRGHAGRLWKRDFAGELMDAHGLTLVDYGFVYARDTYAAQDNITWFVLEKQP